MTLSDGHTRMVLETVDATPLRHVHFGGGSVFFVYPLQAFSDPFVPEHIVRVDDPRQNQTLSITCEDRTQ